jgi:hypothetical protein
MSAEARRRPTFVLPSPLSFTLALTALFALLPAPPALGFSRESLSEPTQVEDTDRDALPDPLESLMGTDPANDDTDGDGFSDGHELAVGTDPTVYDYDDGIDDRTGIAMAFYPLPGKCLGILFLVRAGVNWEGFDTFRVFAGRVGTGGEWTLQDRTRYVVREGVPLRASCDRVFGLQIAMSHRDIGGRVAMCAEVSEFGDVHSVSRLFGLFRGEFYIAEYRDGGDGFFYGFYDFSKNIVFAFAPLTGSWPLGEGTGDDGGFLDDFVYMEKIRRVRGPGFIIDTVVDRACEEDPGYRCPRDKNTIGEVRVIPVR